MSWLATLGLVEIVGTRRTVLLNPFGGSDPRIISIAELVTVAYGCIVPALVAPQLRSWESGAAATKIRMMAGIFAAAVILSPVAIIYAVQLPHGHTAELWNTSSNALLVTAASTLLSALFGAFSAAPFSMFLYVGLILAQEAIGESKAAIPLARVGDPKTVEGSVIGGLILSVCAVGVAMMTLGKSRLAGRLDRHRVR